MEGLEDSAYDDDDDDLFYEDEYVELEDSAEVNDQWSWGRLVLDKLTEIRNKVDASFSGIDRINEGQGLLFLCRFELPIAPFEDNLA